MLDTIKILFRQNVPVVHLQAGITIVWLDSKLTINIRQLPSDVLELRLLSEEHVLMILPSLYIIYYSKQSKLASYLLTAKT